MRVLVTTLVLALMGAMPPATPLPTNAPSTAPAGEDAATPRPPSGARMGYIAPTARTWLTQPVLDRYAQFISRSFADAEAITIVAVPTANGQSTADASLCRSEKLSGFVQPHAQWRVTRTSVSVQSGFVVSDCVGEIFFEGEELRSDARHLDVLPQFQMDSLQPGATRDVIGDFQKYVRAHATAWNRLLQNGSITAAPSPAP